MLASVSIGLRVSEVVNIPNYTVSASVPLNIFVHSANNN
jgi:acetamidase/formamidase